MVKKTTPFRHQGPSNRAISHRSTKGNATAFGWAKQTASAMTYAFVPSFRMVTLDDMPDPN
jgi:hypothetical protein